MYDKIVCCVPSVSFPCLPFFFHTSLSPLFTIFLPFLPPLLKRFPKSLENLGGNTELFTALFNQEQITKIILFKYENELMQQYS